MTCLALHRNKFLLSGGEDGKLCVWDCENGSDSLVLLKTFGIKHSILSISVHEESGKVALTVDSGGYLKAWDLHHCLLAYNLPLKSKPHLVKWFSPKIRCSAEKCDRFLVLSDFLADVRDLETGDSIASFSIKDRGQLTCIDFVDQHNLIAGTSMGDLILMCTKNKKQIDFRQAHQGRIKDLVVIGEYTDEDSDFFSLTLFSASSDGFLKAWTVDLELLNLSLIALVDVQCRLTALAAVKVIT